MKLSNDEAEKRSFFSKSAWMLTGTLQTAATEDVFHMSDEDYIEHLQALKNQTEDLVRSIELEVKRVEEGR